MHMLMVMVNVSVDDVFQVFVFCTTTHSRDSSALLTPAHANCSAFGDDFNGWILSYFGFSRCLVPTPNQNYKIAIIGMYRCRLQNVGFLCEFVGASYTFCSAGYPTVQADGESG